ncbi:hypothetical protein [Paraburkholderia sp. 32]|uniref:hypothetical protein n=1 Tax=Paraburkholderia sp. 32 TaxID=2991057 RepID=UPI003D235CB7
METFEPWYGKLRPPPELTPPVALLGEQGVNRAPREDLTIAAETDLQAAEAYLASLTTTNVFNTRHSIYRFFLWSWIITKKPVSSLLHSDIKEYVSFCQDPEARESWYRKAPKHRLDEWFPFEKKFYPPWTHWGKGIVPMFDFWVKHGYAIGNPSGDAFAQKASLKRMRGRGKVAKSLFDNDLWHVVMRAIESLPYDSKNAVLAAERARFFFNLIYFLAPKKADIIDGNMSCFRKEGGEWWWKSSRSSTRNAPRKMLVPKEMLEALVRYRTSWGMTPLPSRTDTTRLVDSVFRSSKRPYHATLILREVATLAIQLLPDELSHKAEVLRSATYNTYRDFALRNKGADASDN